MSNSKLAAPLTTTKGRYIRAAKVAKKCVYFLPFACFVCGQGVDKWHSCEAPSQPAQNSHYDYFPGDTPAAPTFQMHIVSSMIVLHGEENDNGYEEDRGNTSKNENES